MKRLVLIFLTSLCGCVAKFDAGEYVKIVDASALLVPEVCSSADSKPIVETITKFKSDIDWLVIYEGGLPNNISTSKMLADIQKEANNFDINDSNLEENRFFCKEKFELMRHTLSLLLYAEARKPQS